MSGPVPPGRHPNWCGCAGCRRDIAEFESKQFKASGGILAAVIAFAVLGFWPARFWHGQNDMGGWRWDVHSTIACAVWWAVLLAPFAVAVTIDARRKRALRKPPPPGRKVAPAPPAPEPAVCRHPRAVPVDLTLTGERVAWLCPDPPDGCGAQLGPGERSAELSPDGSWPPVRRVPRR